MDISDSIKASFKKVISNLLLSMIIGFPIIALLIIQEIVAFIRVNLMIDPNYDSNLVIALSIFFMLFLMLVLYYALVIMKNHYKNLISEINIDYTIKLDEESQKITHMQTIFDHTLAQEKAQLRSIELKIKQDYEHEKAKMDLVESIRQQDNKRYNQFLDERMQDLNRRETEIDEIINSTSKKYPWLAKLFAEYQDISDRKIENRLRHKSPPALRAADELSQIRKEKKNITQLFKMYEYQLHVYEYFYPQLEEFKEIPPIEEMDMRNNSDEETKTEYELISKWLAFEEFSKLPSHEKWQLALDRYKHRKKSDFQAGIEYERYTGYSYESNGYDVKYQGALMGLNDMGIDLVINSPKEKRFIVQCKRWREERTVHEKHIFQLYGSVVLERISNPKTKIEGIFYTTTKLSETAKKCADILGITVYENDRFNSEYPMIKCNNSKNGKIYHLPFDQQYDRVKIDIINGDCYVSTVKEAEDLGYRHAFKWSGNYEK
jgi:hypothetical protein